MAKKKFGDEEVQPEAVVDAPSTNPEAAPTEAPAVPESPREARWTAFIAKAEAQAASYSPMHLECFKAREAAGEFSKIPDSFE